MRFICQYTALVIFFLNGSQCFGQATLFEPAIISNGHVFGLTINPNGRQLYVVRADVKRDTLTIYESKKKNGRWQPLSVASFSGTFKDIDPFISPAGNQLIFNTNRHFLADSGRTDFDIWAVDLAKTGKAGTPYSLGNVVNSTAADFYATQATNGTLYFTSTRPGGFGKNDLYVSQYHNESYMMPVNLGPLVNTADSESNPYIAPDESYLIFFSNRPGGFGRTDLYISYRQKGKWTEPINLGDRVNSTDAEFCPFVDRKAGVFYFARSLFKDATVIREDIYSIPLKFLNLK